MPENTLAIFDLDGTITRHDTLSRYIGGFLWRHPRRWWRLALCVGPLVRYACGSHDRGVLKGAIIHWTLGGVSRTALSSWSIEFTAQLMRAGLYAEALTCIAAHRRAHAHLVLLSASPDLYVPVIAKVLGFDQCVCSEVLWRSDGGLEGTLVSANRRGPEKARCVGLLLGERGPVHSHAYGNSRSDLEHLQLVSAGTYVNGSPRELAGMPSVRAVRWRTRAVEPMRAALQ